MACPSNKTGGLLSSGAVASALNEPLSQMGADTGPWDAEASPVVSLQMEHQAPLCVSRLCPPPRAHGLGPRGHSESFRAL